MPKMNEDLNVITHLLEVEKKASVLVDDALKESEKRISAANNSLAAQYKDAYSKMVDDLDSQYHTRIQRLDETHKEELLNFKTETEHKPLHTEEFNRLLDSLLFKA